MRTSAAYPELKGRHDYIKRVIQMEEARFSDHHRPGPQPARAAVMGGLKSGGQVIKGEDAFRLIRYIRISRSILPPISLPSAGLGSTRPGSRN
jgi:hypothetical protein